MTDAHVPDDSWDELETLIRGAGEYVRATDDLRPRVLEEAQRQVGGAHLWDGICRAALLALVASVLTTLVRPVPSPPALEGRGQVGAAQRISSESLDPLAPELDAWTPDQWSAVEAFAGVRRRQAELLRPSTVRSERPGA